MARVAEAIDKECFHGRQLRLNFEKDPELKQKNEEFSKELAPKAERDTERVLIERLQQDGRCSFAGGLMHHLFLEEIGFKEILEPFPLPPFFTLPYYGFKIIAKGYYTVRRLAMKGNNIYAVTDLNGKPLFFITESSEIDFRPIISRCATMLRDWGISQPLLVFDRGGYGIHFFQRA